MKVKATINRITDKPESTVKAYASVSFDGAFAVHGIKVCENEKGRFVSMPSTSYLKLHQTQTTEIEIEETQEEAEEAKEYPEQKIGM